MCRDLYKFAEELHAFYPFIYELCKQDGHFNFQCLHFNDSIVSQFCDNMITHDLYEELQLFLMCEELSQKISCLRMSTLGANITSTEFHFHCAVNCCENAYIGKIRKNGTYQSMKGKMFLMLPLTKWRDSSKFLLLLLLMN